MTEEITIFHKIVNKTIPSTCVWEDDRVYAFNDVNPQAPVHIMIVPKQMDGLNMLSSAEERHESILGHLMYAATLVAKKLELDDGFRIVINNGKNGCQSVNYLHLHLLGGAKFGWPPGTNY